MNTSNVDDADASVEDPKLRSDSDRRDWLLVALVKLANKGIQFPITLSVGGAIVSGTLTSNVSYFEGVSKEIASGTGDKVYLEVFSDFFKTIGEGLAEASKATESEDNEDGGDAPEPGYIHLENARVFQAGNGHLPNNRGVWWRGHISSVDAFWMGALSSN